MPTITSSRLALATSSLALAVALGGVGYAAVKIETKDIKNNAVTSPKVKKDTLTGKDVKESSLAKVPSAGKADSAGQVDGMSAAKIAYQSASATPTVVFNGGGLVITASCDSATHDLTVTGRTTKTDSSLYITYTDTDDDVVLADDLESGGFTTAVNADMLAGASVAQEDAGITTFVYAAPDGTRATGTMGVDGFFKAPGDCALMGTVLFG
jgi:hypothetical protein